MKIDIKIIGGQIVDPERNYFSTGDVLIKGNRIVSAEPGTTVEANMTIDAQDCLVMPGLIDFHAHLYASGTEIGVKPDCSFLPLGITTAVDAGSAGEVNFNSFYESTISPSSMRIFSFLNMCPAGLSTSRYHEDINPKYFDQSRIAELMERYKGHLLGLKIRQSKDIAGALGIEPLKAAVKIAEELKCPVVVHTTNPPVLPEEIVSILRPGDVYCHVHHGTGHTILTQDGKVRPGMFEAQKKGIIFDAANGRNHYSVKVAKTALEEGFLPNVISSDVTSKTQYGDFVFGLPYVMMKYLNMGMALMDIVAACTSKPARIIGQTGKLGTLKPGAFADVAIFRLAQKKIRIKDNFGESFDGDKWLIPQLTILNGKTVYRQIDF